MFCEKAPFSIIKARNYSCYYHIRRRIMEKKVKGFSLKGSDGKLYYGWVVAVMAAIITGFVYNGIISTIGVMMLPVMTEFGIEPPQFTLYQTILSAVSIVALFVAQKFFTKKHIKKVLVIAGILGTISFVGFSMAKSITTFYIFAVLQGICFTTMTMTPCELLVSNWFGPKARGRAMSLFMTGMTLVYVADINILQRIVAASGWRNGYLFLAAGIAVSIICAFFCKWSPEEIGVERMGDFSEEEMKAMEGQNALAVGYSFGQIVKKPLFWLICISCTLAVMASSSVLSHGIPTMIYGGYTPERATAITSLLSTIMIFTGPLIGVIMDKVSPAVAAGGSALCFAGACVGLSLISVNPALGVGVFCCLYIFGVASINIISPVIMGYLFGDKEMPKLLSWMNIFIGIGGVVGAMGVSIMLTKFGTYQIPWLIAAAVLVLCAVVRIIATLKKNAYKPGDENK